MCLLSCHSSVADGFAIPQKAKTLLQILVEELPKHGGWPSNCETVFQDYDKELRFDGLCRGVFCSQLAKNYREKGQMGSLDHLMVTREQYEAAVLKATTQATITTDADGWIDWAGGECPVDGEAVVEVKYRNPKLYNINNCQADDFSWSHDDMDSDIIAYRLHQPQEASLLDALEEREVETREAIAQGTDDLNECIGHVRSDEDVLRDYNLAKCDHCGRVGEIDSKCDHGAEDITLLTHFMLDEIRESEINIRLDDAYELAQHLISVGYRKQ